MILDDKDRSDNAPESKREGGYMRPTCNAHGCRFNDQGNGLCLFHGRLADFPNAWGRVNNWLANPECQSILWGIQELDRNLIDHSEASDIDGNPVPDDVWEQRKRFDTYYLTDWMAMQLRVNDFPKEVCTRREGEAPKAWAARIRAALLVRMVSAVIPPGLIVGEKRADPAKVDALLARVLGRGRALMGEGAYEKAA